MADGKSSWVEGQFQFICPKCKHTKKKARYVQAMGEVIYVRHDPADAGCGPKCFKGEHLHVICCDCGYRQWDYCSDHVEGEPERKAPLFTERHHDAIIKVLHIALESASEAGYEDMNSLKEAIGIMFAEDNPAFDRHKFDDA